MWEKITIRVTWIILILTIAYYFLLKKLEMKNIDNTLEYLTDVYSQYAKIFNMKIKKPDPEIQEPSESGIWRFFEGAHGKMIIIMIVCVCILSVFISDKTTNKLGFIVALFITLAELSYVYFINRKFYLLDANKLIKKTLINSC